MSFKELLFRAKGGEDFSFNRLLDMYRPLLLKEAFDDGVVDEDLYQELCLTLFECVQTFKV